MSHHFSVFHIVRKNKRIEMGEEEVRRGNKIAESHIPGILKLYRVSLKIFSKNKTRRT